MFEQYINWFENLSFYKEYLSRFPEPLNNPVFLSALAIFLAVSLISSLINHISSWRFHRRIKAKNRKLEEEKLNQKIREAAEIRERNKDSELFNTYMRFIMMAQMQNMSSLTNLTFEQWQHALSKSPKGVGVVEETPVAETEMEEMEEAKESEVVTVEELEEPMPDKPQEKPVEQESMPNSVEPENEWLEEIEPEIELDLPELLASEPENEYMKEESVQKIEPLLSEEPEELTPEQQSDFSKLIAMMQAENRQREQVEEYNKKKTEITRQNAAVLEKSLRKDMEKLGKSDSASYVEDEVERRKRQAVAAMEAEQAGKQQKSGLGKGKK